MIRPDTFVSGRGRVERPPCPVEVRVHGGTRGGSHQKAFSHRSGIADGRWGRGSMTARASSVVRRMSLAKASIVVFVAVALLTSLLMIKMSQGEALPACPTDDQRQVPHYFGPWPNWVLSPLTLPDATVAITGGRHGRDGDGDGRRQRRRHRHHHHQPRQRLQRRDGRHHRRRHGSHGHGRGHQQRGGRRGQRDRRRLRVQIAHRHPVGRRRHHCRDRDRLRQRQRLPAAERRQRLHASDRGPRRAGRPGRDPGHGPRHVRRGHGRDHRGHPRQPRLGLSHRAGGRDPRRHTLRPHHQRRLRRLGDRHAGGLERDARHLRRRLHLRSDRDLRRRRR